MQLSSSFAEARAPRPSVNLGSEPLWTTEVKRIDLSRQAYERVPVDQSAAYLVATVSTVSSV